jgi:hypothetical protein
VDWIIDSNKRLAQAVQQNATKVPEQQRSQSIIQLISQKLPATKRKSTSLETRKYTFDASLYCPLVLSISAHQRPHLVAFLWPEDPILCIYEKVNYTLMNERRLQEEVQSRKLQSLLSS